MNRFGSLFKKSLKFSKPEEKNNGEYSDFHPEFSRRDQHFK